jgi:hypothetical protein
MNPIRVYGLKVEAGARPVKRIAVRKTERILVVKPHIDATFVINATPA